MDWGGGGGQRKGYYHQQPARRPLLPFPRKNSYAVLAGSRRYGIKDENDASDASTRVKKVPTAISV